MCGRAVTVIEKGTISLGFGTVSTGIVDRRGDFLESDARSLSRVEVKNDDQRFIGRRGP